MKRATLAAQLAQTQMRIAQTKQDIALVKVRSHSEPTHGEAQLELLENALEMHVAIKARLSAELSVWSP